MKKLIALALSLLMLLSLAAACGSNTGTGGTSGNAGGSSADAPTLIWFMGNVAQPDQDEVEARLNEISVAKVGAKMKTLYMNDEEAKLALSAGDPWDITFTCEWYNNFAEQAMNGYFADITDKIKTLAPKLWASMPDEVWEGARINGKIVGIPVKKDYAAEMFFLFDKELYADLGMDIPANMDFFALEPYLAAAKKAIQDGNPLAKSEYPIMLAKGGFAGTTSMYDMVNHAAMLGLPYSAIGTPDANKIVFLLEHKDAVDRLKALHKWFELGYINPDGVNIDTEARVFAVRTGQGFYGADAIWSGSNGFPIAISKFSGPYLSTGSIRGSMNAINAKSKNIDLALKYLELVNSDQEYRDILRYGIEGKHWNKTDDGLAKKTDAGRTGYSPWAFSQGSYALASVEWAEGVTVDPHMWDVVFAGYKDLQATSSIGFSFDLAKVEAEVAACQAVKTKYWESLITGTLDPDTVIPKYLQEAEAAGLRTVMAECQAQYDAFLAGKK